MPRLIGFSAVYIEDPLFRALFCIMRSYALSAFYLLSAYALGVFLLITLKALLNNKAIFKKPYFKKLEVNYNFVLYYFLLNSLGRKADN